MYVTPHRKQKIYNTTCLRSAVYVCEGALAACDADKQQPIARHICASELRSFNVRSAAITLGTKSLQTVAGLH